MIGLMHLSLQSLVELFVKLLREKTFTVFHKFVNGTKGNIVENTIWHGYYLYLLIYYLIKAVASIYCFHPGLLTWGWKDLTLIKAI